jgi:tRNA(Arg) A34 adenosine deaminase TadA
MKRTFKNHTPYLGKQISPTKKIKRYFSLARNVAFNSDYGKIRHGALLVKGGSVINTCWNKDKFCSFGSRFRDPDRGHATIHAELGCILGMPRSVTIGADIYVCRINKRGQFRNSKPCAMCHAALKHVGVKRVFYTTGDNTIEMYKL